MFRGMMNLTTVRSASTMLKTRAIATNLLTKRVEDKSRSKNLLIVNDAYFQLIGGDYQGVRPSLLVHSTSNTYLQTCAYGTQRRCYSTKKQENLLITKSRWNPDVRIHCDLQTLSKQGFHKTSIDFHKPEGVSSSTPPDDNKKRTLSKRIIDELKHYYHGFRLLFIDLKLSSRYVRKKLKGEQLSRREHQQLVRSTSDLFRLVPFSVFIIVPFMEFLLPVFLKFFPSLLPSQFQTSQDKDRKIKNQLKIKIDMAKFLQETLDEMAFQAKGESHSEEAKKFAKFFEEVRASGAGASNADILKYSKLFEDEITLDSMTRQQLSACCKLLDLKPLGTNGFLRFQLRTRLEYLRADDEMIKKEGIQSLTVSELQAACRARGMRALGVPIERLQAQLSQWLELSLNEKIPPSLLLLSRALYVPENIPTTEQLRVTLKSLPELAGTEVKYLIGETEGKVDNKTKLEFLRQEEEEIKREELLEEEEKYRSNYDEALIDKAEEIIERAAKMNQTTILKVVKLKSEKNDLTMELLESIERDLDKMLPDEEGDVENNEHPEEEYDLRELKEEMEEYREEIDEKELQRIKESKAARRLSKRVDKLIVNLDKFLDKMEYQEKLKRDIEKLKRDDEKLKRDEEKKRTQC